MKILHSWLQTYFDDPLPAPEKVGELLTFHAFEVEGVEMLGAKDAVIDIDILPNRSSDCLSHRGIAKELSVILGKPLSNDPLKELPRLEPKTSQLSIQIENPELCDRFSGAVISGIKVGPSPKWLVDALSALGQKSINNVVDATNYVMLNIGQPLHAFDAQKMTAKNGKYVITVRTAKKGEKITTLTGEEYTLEDRVLLITDGNDSTPLGIAGIKGGIHAEISKDTTEVLIESAHFNPTNIRKTSQSLKLRTEASTRFENEPPIELTSYGLEAAVELIAKIAGGSLTGYVDVFPKKQCPYKVGVSLEEVNKLLGSSMSEHDMTGILERFGFEYKKVKPRDVVLEKAAKYVGTPYKYFSSLRYDGTTTFDCSSYTRHLFLEGGIAIPRISIDQYFYGEEITEHNTEPGDLVFSVSSNKDNIHHNTVVFMPGQEMPVGISHCGILLGDRKVIHASGKDSKGEVVIEDLKDSPDFKTIVGYRRMVQNNTERYNITIPFERLDLRIMEDLIEEIGRIYGYENIPTQIPEGVGRPARVNKRFYYQEKIRTLLEEQGFTEIYTYTFRDHGEVALANALAADKSWLRSDLAQGITEALDFNIQYADLLGVQQVKVFEFGTVFRKEGEHVSFSFGIRNAQKKHMKNETAELEHIVDLLSQLFGNMIQIEIQGEVIELPFDTLIENLPVPQSYDRTSEPKEDVVYKPFSAYPFALRDIAVWVPRGVSEGALRELISSVASPVLVRMTLFDVYQKEDKTSFAFRLVLQAIDRTLTEKEISAIMVKVTTALEEKGYTVR